MELPMIPLFWVSVALAWEETGYRLAEESFDFTLEWSEEDAPFEEEEIRDILDDVRDEWTKKTCTPLNIALSQMDQESLLKAEEGHFRLVFGDPGSDLNYGDPWFVQTRSDGEEVDHGGTTYTTVNGAWISFADDIDFVTDAEASASDCVDARSLRTVITQALGWVFGLDRVCRSGESCTEEERLASMNASDHVECDASGSSLASDDLEGLAALYGSAVEWACEPVFGEILRVDCSAVVEGATAYEWNFGDGTTVDSDVASHVYEAGGAHQVELCVTLDGCEYEQCYQQTIYTAGPGTVEGDYSSTTVSVEGGTGECGGQAGILGLLAFFPIAFGLRRSRGTTFPPAPPSP